MQAHNPSPSLLRLAAAIPILMFAALSRADGPATLEECYKSALRTSETLSIADQAVRREEAQYKAARGLVLPTVGFKDTEFYQDTTGLPAGQPASVSIRHQPSARFYASQPIFSGFREFAGLKGLRAAMESGREDRARAEQLLYQDVAAAFYAAVEADERLAVVSSLRKSSDDRIKELQERVRVGRSRQSELLAARSQLASLEAQEQDAQGLRRSAYEVLSYLAGAPVAGLRDETPEAAPPADLGEYLKKVPGRPDLLSAEAQTRSTGFLLTAARRGIWPTVDVSGNYYTHRSPNGFIDWDALLTIDAPIFRGGQWKASVEGAAADHRAASAAGQEARRAAERDVRDLHAQLTSAVLETAKLFDAARLAEESYKSQVKEYRLGLVTNIEVLSALSAWEQTRLDEEHKRLEAKTLAVRLRVALGDIR